MKNIYIYISRHTPVVNFFLNCHVAILYLPLYPHSCFLAPH